jgi:hypothetical protein
LPDPEGWELFIKAIEKPDELLMNIAKKAGPANPKDSALQAKCLKYFVK